MNSKTIIAIAAGLAIGAGGCSDKKTTPATTEAGNATFNAAMTSVQSEMDQFDSMLPNNEGASSVGVFSLPRKSSRTIRPNAAFSTNWDGGSADVLSNPRCSGGSSTICSTPVTPKQWMGYQLDPSAVRENGSDINIFGRFESAVSISCAIMNLVSVDATTGYPTDGTHTITFTAAGNALLVSKCGFSEDDVPDVGLSFDVVVSTPASTAVYDKLIVMDLPDEMGGAEQKFYMKVDSSAINILSGENNATDSQLSRTIVALDKTTGVLRVEYFSGGSTTSGGFNFYRLYYDTTNDVGAMFGYESDATASGGIRYTLVGKPETGTEGALSMDLNGWGSGASWNSNYMACVQMDDGTIASDNTLSCAGSVTGTDIDDTNLAAMYNDAFTNRASTGWYTNADHTTTLSYSASTIFSALATH